MSEVLADDGYPVFEDVDPAAEIAEEALDANDVEGEGAEPTEEQIDALLTLMDDESGPAD